MSGRILWIDEQALRFSAAEAAQLFEAYGLRADPTLVDELTEHAEGWIIGLQLIAQSLQTYPERSSIPRLGQKLLFDYLAAEVLQQLPVEAQRFVTESSVLPLIDPDLCDQVLERGDSADQIAELLGRNLFVVPLDGGTYRYHHLFRDFLLARCRRIAGGFIRSRSRR